MEGPKPAPPEIVCKCPETAPGLTIGSKRSRTRRPGHDIRKKAEVGATSEVTRPSARVRVLACILTLGVESSGTSLK